LPALDGEHEADVVVIGAGYTGMWAAWHLKRLEPEARVIVLEAARAGHGPSGRNGGFCNTMWHQLPLMRMRFGDDGARAVGTAALNSVGEIGAFCEENGIDAWYRRGGYLQVSTAGAHDAVNEDALAAGRELGAVDAVRELDQDEVARRCRSPLFRGGVFFPGAATVQPARLAFGLLGKLLESGVEVFEGAKVTRLEAPPGGGVEARTASGGAVRAGHAIVAIGGAAGGPGWGARGRLTVVSSHIVLTEPVPDVLEEIGWTGGECITDSRALVHYFRTTPDGRIAFGWGGGRIGFDSRLGGRIEVDPATIEQVKRDLLATFPQLEGRRIDRAWGGPIDASPSHLPVITTRAGGRIATAFGYTGNGVAPSQMIGRTLASLALDRSDDASRLPLVDPSPRRVPPEPFRWIGGAAIRSALIRKERAEVEGRRPGRLARTVSAIPERIGFHIGR
jgi:glycine/D-amino acid oxidase-like deaminating enzyme